MAENTSQPEQRQTGTTDRPTDAGSTRGLRLQFGLTSAIMILAVLVIVVFANWIAVRKANNVRFDLTELGRYTLSPQTRQVIAGVEQPVRIVTLFIDPATADDTTATRIRQFRDLLDEYDRRGGQPVEVEHITAGDIDREQALYEDVAAQFTEPMAAGREAVTEATTTLETLDEFAAMQVAQIDQQLARLGPEDEAVASALRNLRQAYSGLQQEGTLGEAVVRLRRLLDETLPDYGAMVERIRSSLETYRSNFLVPSTEGLREIAGNDRYSQRARDVAQRLLPDVQAMLDTINSRLAALEGLDFDAYTAAIRTIQTTNSATIFAGGELVVLNLDDVYLQVTASTDDPQQESRTRFRGEEAVTGAIVSLTMDNPPLIVFVNVTGQPALGPGGQYSYLAERLRAMNIQLDEYNPMRPDQQLPEAPEDSRLVWVVLPPPAMNPGNPMMVFQLQQALQRFVERIEAGDDGLVLMAGPNPMARFGQMDPIGSLLAGFGVEVLADQLLLRNVFVQEGRQVPTTELLLTRWPDDNLISEALSGQTVLFAGAVPLLIEDDPGDEDAAEDGEEAPALEPVLRKFVILSTGDEVWAETNWQDRTELPRPNRDEKRGPLPTAVGIETETRRVVAFGERAFAADQMVVAQQPVLTADGLDFVQVVQLPGNVELMINSIYWTAGLDELIATGARSQDVRRWQQIDEQRYTLLTWLLIAGLPVATLLAGVGVWAVRRR